ncbi:MAG: hypothetical protein KDJ75_04725 [Alphaproteobacteria bacterium]|nr:hypothetical protein [Alphaproteobacteria bacterium]
MEFSFIILCIIATPIIVFSVGPKAAPLIKTGRLLFLLLMFFLVTGHVVLLDECYNNNLPEDCREYKSVMAMLVFFPLIMGLGWCEFAWRERHKQLAWPLWVNLKYGILSNILIFLSLLMTVFTFFMLFR